MLLNNHPDNRDFVVVETNKKKRRLPGTRKPVSLNPLKFDEAVSDLLKVKPQPKEGKREKRD